MSSNNAPVRTQQHATANRTRADRPLTDRLRHQARVVAQDVREMGGIAKDAAQEQLGHWRDTASDYYQQACRAGGACRQFVRERPFNSILITAGVGVIAAGGGLLLGRFSMRHIRERPAKSVLMAAGVGLLVGGFWMRRSTAGPTGTTYRRSTAT